MFLRMPGFQYLSYTDMTRQTYTMGIERSEWAGDKVVDEEDVAPAVECSTESVFLIPKSDFDFLANRTYANLARDSKFF